MADGKLLGGRYEIGVRLAKGGFGEVFAGATVGDFGFRRPVAIKRLEAPNPAELALAQRLRHPNIVEVLDVFAADHLVYLVMELADAGALGDVLAHSGQAPVPVAAYVADQVLAALVVAHAEGVVHRDVNPQNVLLWTDGRVKLTDFGIAKAEGVDAEPTRSGFVKGKLSYLAPEQVRQEPIDGRTDLWALGVMLYEMVAGRRPYRRGTRSDAEVLAQIAQAKRPDLDGLRLPDWFQGVLEGLLAPAIEDRWASASAARVALAASYRAWASGREVLVERLTQSLAGQAVGPVAPTPPPTRNARPRRLPPAPPEPTAVVTAHEVVSAEVLEAALSHSGRRGGARGLWAAVGLLAVIVVGLAGVLAGRTAGQADPVTKRGGPAVITVEHRSAPLEAPKAEEEVGPAPTRAQGRGRVTRPVPRPRPVLGPEFFEPGGTLEVK